MENCSTELAAKDISVKPKLWKFFLKSCMPSTIAILSIFVTGYTQMNSLKFFRDLKPENFLYLTEAEDSPLKVIDFGLSKIADANHYMTTRAGTVAFILTFLIHKALLYFS